jgi:hypothetical protein
LRHTLHLFLKYQPRRNRFLATNERDVKTSAEYRRGRIKIKYQQGAYFQSDIHRHVYFNGNATIGLADFSFEIDDAGNHLIITKYAKNGFSEKPSVLL